MAPARRPTALPANCTAAAAHMGLDIVTAATAIGPFRMAVLARADVVSGAIKKQGYWEWRSPEEMLGAAGRAREERQRDRANGPKVVPYIPDEPPKVKAALRRFLDVGANLGWYAFLFAQAGWDVLAIEPRRQHRRAIEATRCLNPELGRRITLLSVAVGSPEDAVGGACFFLASSAGSRALCGAAAAATNCTHLLVAPRLKPRTCKDGKVRRSCLLPPYQACERAPLLTLDSLLLHNTRGFGAARIGVGGLECRVLAGAGSALRSTMKHARPLVLQVEGAAPKSASCARAFASKLKYEVAQTRVPPANKLHFILHRKP
uniref:Uncharacterized protein n=1 Tax=Calcidiscus leptoporus TaxID=127549 RepID=A0A7S0P261_9EUKA|mmetsp:Transcript_49479/g.114345  ORF Transcript_49479/g.114345 Transcript_49479/m.114345 type:complete len:319 (+) Transcript_49479:105-1061(+)